MIWKWQNERNYSTWNLNLYSNLNKLLEEIKKNDSLTPDDYFKRKLMEKKPNLDFAVYPNRAQHFHNSGEPDDYIMLFFPQHTPRAPPQHICRFWFHTSFAAVVPESAQGLAADTYTGRPLGLAADMRELADDGYYTGHLRGLGNMFLTAIAVASLYAFRSNKMYAY